MDFLNHREGDMVYYLVFLLSPLQCTVTELQKLCVSVKNYKYHDKAVEVTVNSKEENSQDFCLIFGQEFGLCTHLLANVATFSLHR
jgi:hypothetical protein